MKHIIVSFVYLLLSSTLQAAPDWLSVQTRTTWATLTGPEVHFLLRNESSKDVYFAFDMAAMSEMKQSCVARWRAWDKSTIDQLMPTVQRELSWAHGVVPAHGWAHRMIILLGGVEKLPCEISVVIKAHNTDFLGTVFSSPIQISPNSLQISLKPGRRNSNVVFNSMIERDFRDDQVLLRILANNNGSDAERVWISNRSLQCPAGVIASWNTLSPEPQGADSGPLAVDAGGWGVFVTPIRLIKGQSLDKCNATIEISKADTLHAKASTADWEIVKTLTVSLKPTGYIRLINEEDGL